jgi:hypothetical protein
MEHSKRGGHTKARTADGSPVRILHPERRDDSETLKLPPDDVGAWLGERGFELTNRSPSSVRLQWEDVEAFLVVEEGELAEIILTFTLTRDSPSRWDMWKFRVEQLCEAWGLALYDSQRGFLVEASEILRVLADTQAWKDFEVNFKWPSVV